tara:strand:+ start:572 stop:775 length:204 start_codon:yes stop_codon:yes gene_type:complete
MAKFGWAYIDASGLNMPQNATTITADMNASIPANYNAVLYGPITVGSGATLVVNSGANLKIIDIQDA